MVNSPGKLTTLAAVPLPMGLIWQVAVKTPPTKAIVPSVGTTASVVWACPKPMHNHPAQHRVRADAALAERVQAAMGE